MVIDDQETSLIIVRSLLERWHFNVTTASTGENGIQEFEAAQLRGEPFELLLVDWKMPGMNGLETVSALERSITKNAMGKPPTIIMITAYGRDRLLKESQSISFDSVLMKPVTPSSLLDTLVQIQHGNSGQTQTIGDAFSVARVKLHRIRGARILLVEDNDLNQQVAEEFLGKCGLKVTIAGNGQEALDNVRTTQFDAVLMDLHMPVMDGFEATRQIRATPGTRDLPIIAMTAAAMTQDREASALVGMNDHIAKPIDSRELADVLLRWIKPNDSAPLSDTPVQNHLTTSAAPEGIAILEQLLPAVSVRKAIARVGNNLASYTHLLGTFARRHHDTESKLRNLALGEHFDKLCLEAHNLKGEAGNLGLEDVQNAAAQLEQRIKSGTTTDLRSAVADLAVACASAVELIATIQKMPPFPPEKLNTTMGVRQIDTGKIRQLLARLQEQLRSKDLDARRTALEIDEQARGTALVEDFAPIVLSVQQLHYDVALSLIDQLLEQHQWGQNLENKAAPTSS